MRNATSKKRRAAAHKPLGSLGGHSAIHVTIDESSNKELLELFALSFEKLSPRGKGFAPTARTDRTTPEPVNAHRERPSRIGRAFRPVHGDVRYDQILFADERAKNLTRINVMQVDGKGLTEHDEPRLDPWYYDRLRAHTRAGIQVFERE